LSRARLPFIGENYSAHIEDGTIETGRIAKGIDDIEANDILALRDALE
jgi:hypothetical protein